MNPVILTPGSARATLEPAWRPPAPPPRRLSGPRPRPGASRRSPSPSGPSRWPSPGRSRPRSRPSPGCRAWCRWRPCSAWPWARPSRSGARCGGSSPPGWSFSSSSSSRAAAWSSPRAARRRTPGCPGRRFPTPRSPCPTWPPGRWSSRSPPCPSWPSARPWRRRWTAIRDWWRWAGASPADSWARGSSSWRPCSGFPRGPGSQGSRPSARRPRWSREAGRPPSSSLVFSSCSSVGPPCLRAGARTPWSSISRPRAGWRSSSTRGSTSTPSTSPPTTGSARRLQAEFLARRRRPYEVFESAHGRRPETVLVLGAGAGNDVAVALGQGVLRVVAVEIDPVVLELGRDLNLSEPYSDPRVEAVVDAPRHFLHSSRETFDLIVLALPDIRRPGRNAGDLPILSRSFTREALEEAKRHLAEGGLFVAFSSVHDDRLVPRLLATLGAAFGERTRLIVDGPRLFNTTLLASRDLDSVRRPRRGDAAPGGGPPRHRRLALPFRPTPGRPASRAAASGRGGDSRDRRRDPGPGAPAGQGYLRQQPAPGDGCRPRRVRPPPRA